MPKCILKNFYAKLNMKFNSRFLLLPLLLLIVVFAACRKDDPPVVSKDTGTLLMHLHAYVGNNEVEEYNTVYTTPTGRKVSLDMAQMYLSDFQLIRPDGSRYSIPDKKVLQDLKTEAYSLGEVPVGDYKALIFRLGFDAAANRALPSTDPALLDRPEMWFGSAPQPDGYVFLHARGMVDPSPNASGTVEQMQPFEYKVGTSANNLLINLPDKDFTVVKDQAAYVHLLADYSQLFDGIDISQPGNLLVLTPADNAIMPGTWITQNISLLFRYEE